jgi:SAM-dependent methyltransferase
MRSKLLLVPFLSACASAPGVAPLDAGGDAAGHVRGTTPDVLAACRRGAPHAAGTHGAEHAKPGEHAGHHAPGGHGNHRFDDAAKWSKVFDDPARDAWQKPEVVVGALALKPTDVVADVGAGTGYFSARFAKLVPEGKVYAEDVEETLIAHLTERAAKEGLANLTPVLGAFEDPKLPAPVDVTFVCDTYHHIEAPVPFFERVGASTKPGGRLVIVDFAPGELPVGPPAQMRTPPERLVEELGRAGWKLQAFDCESLPYQYIATFTR